MSEPVKPSDDAPDPSRPADPAAEAQPLEVMPDATPTPSAEQNSPGAPPRADPNQALTVAPTAPASPPPVPIDYAMPAPKTWLPTPAMVRNFGCIFKMLFGFTVLLLLGYFALMALNPKARSWALQGSAAGSTARGPTPFKAVNQILAIPAQALGKTDEVVQANNARAGLLDGVIAQEENPAATAAAGRSPSRPPANPFAAAATTGPAGKPGEPLTPEQERAAHTTRLMAMQEKLAAQQASGEIPVAPVTAVRATAIAPAAPEALEPVTLPGGIVISPASPADPPAPTRTFLFWVVNLNISGINPPRLLINGRLVHAQQEISVPHGITFERFDEPSRLLVFRDQTGAVVTRSY